jgi:hypothetical protein
MELRRVFHNAGWIIVGIIYWDAVAAQDHTQYSVALMHEHMLLAYWAIILTSAVLTKIQVQLQTQLLSRLFAYKEPSLSSHGI